MAHVLVVDDDPSVADAISRTLRSDGQTTVVVHNGWDAIEAAKAQHPDLVVLDVKMPGMDGYQVCRELRSDPDTASLPIIFLTARSMIEDKVEGYGAGADDYLTKPFAIQELALRVNALLRRSQSRSTEGRLDTVVEAAGRGPTQDGDEATLVVGALRLDCRTFEVSTSERTALLTPIEFELLSHLMRHSGQVFSSERLLQEVWDYPPGTGDPALVRMHVRNLRSKIEPLGVESPVFIRTVSRRGYTVRTD